MINSILFNKTYIVEPWFNSDNSKLETKVIKLTPNDRGYSQGKREDIYRYIPLFEKGLRIDFNPNLNIIVGTNGCGKSQLFKILDSKINGKSHEYDLSDIIIESDNVNSFGFDFESDALKNTIKPNPSDHKNFLSDSILIMDSNEKSHGENTKILLNTMNDIHGKVLFLDEPECGLDLRSQYNLVEKIIKLSKTNQVFVITHNKIIIDSCEQVYDLDRNRWVTPDDLFHFISKLI